jgi:hypothetical protein
MKMFVTVEMIRGRFATRPNMAWYGAPGHERGAGHDGPVPL